MTHYRNQKLLVRQRRPLVTNKNAVAKGFSQLMIIGVVIAVTLLFYVWSRVEVVRLNYAILEVSKVEKKLYLENEHLKVELATLQAPGRLAYLAKTQKELKNPESSQIIYMK